MPRPHLEFYDHQESQPVHLALWAGTAQRALPLILAEAKSADAPLLHLDEVEISLVSDDAIARVHGEFMDDPTPTDVITFHHGEILLSLDTAQRQALENGQDYEREVALYVIHGLLHLAGWEDHEERERATMHALQERILSAAA